MFGPSDYIVGIQIYSVANNNITLNYIFIVLLIDVTILLISSKILSI